MSETEPGNLVTRKLAVRTPIRLGPFAVAVFWAAALRCSPCGRRFKRTRTRKRRRSASVFVLALDGPCFAEICRLGQSDNGKLRCAHDKKPRLACLRRDGASQRVRGTSRRSTVSLYRGHPRTNPERLPPRRASTRKNLTSLPAQSICKLEEVAK